ncbi:pilus assembly protein PilM [Pseudothauera nasutitermitis]|uniref:Pilus assembly protein PilM n=1 Tax=Pseudothauera nasutitermitis TaxID=2565930 RepID=A0A4S4AUF2_9RHOO|nr:pilus assembly protein PilM [Pseudothauera nasutitermitis]THF63581.1 pilus assembly protein PilM [Pseudothauera nasutitermitis]
MFGKLVGKRSGSAADGHVGLALSGERLCAVHLRRMADQPPELLARLDAPGDPARALEALAPWVARHGLRGVPAALTLDYGDYLIQQMEKPSVPAEELRSALRWRLKDQLDYSPADAVIDYFEAPAARQKRIEPVQVVAARASQLKPRIDAIRAAGLDPQRIDIPEFALRNLVSRALNVRETTALLYFQPRRGTLQILREDQFYFARALDQGLEALARGGDGGFSDIDDRIALEAQRTMDYYDSHFGHGPVKRVLVLGGGADLRRLADYVTTALGVPASLVGPAELARGLEDDADTRTLPPLAVGGALGFE